MYGQFVGSWDVESSLQGAGEWHWEWALGGRAVTDVIHPLGAPPEQHGMTLRGYDAANDVWHLFYTSPADDEFVQLVGRRDGDRIVQDGRELTGERRRVRWSFSEITPTSYLWRGEWSADDGRTWTLAHEMRATRRS